MGKFKVIFFLFLCLCLDQTNPAQTQEKKIIFGGIINGKAISLPPPQYSKEAENACAGGRVEVEVLLSEKAEVISAKAISGDELLRESAVEAAKKAKFRPTNHLFVRVRGIIVYNFEPKVKCVNVGVVNKKAVNLPKPNAANIIHPKHLQIKKEEIVAVQIIVDESGNVIYANALSGHPLLRASCENSAQQTKFRPTMIDGPPIRVKALLAYKFKPDGTVDTDIEKDDKDVIGTQINLVKPPQPFCNCIFGGNSSVLVQAKIDEKGHITEAKAVNGHPILKNISEKAALESKFLPTNIRSKITIVYEYEGGHNWSKISDVYVKKVEIEKPIIIGHSAPNTKPIFAPKPKYPAAARAVGVFGEVKVEILIDEEGNVEETKVVSGHPLLRVAAERAALQTKYKPTLISGKAVKVRDFMVFNFEK